MSQTFTIYRSSAGSGKTRTLAKEYLRLALRLRAQYFKHVLAVTFTNKATQEMKDRILAYLDEFAKGRPGDLASELTDELKLDAPTFQQHAQEVQAAILHEYSHFSISTIDAFFQKVIRAFTREAGLTGDYRLEIDQDAVLEDVIANLIEELGDNKELTDWVVEFARENLENERPWDIRTNLLEFSREIFREEFKAIEREVGQKTSEPGYFRNLRQKLQAIRFSVLSPINKLAKEALDILNAQAWDQGELTYGRSGGVYSALAGFATCRQVNKLPELKSRFREFAASPDRWPSNKTRYAAEIANTARRVAPLLQQIVDHYDRGLVDALSAEVALQNLYVFGLVSDISRKLREFKAENNLMLLADAPKFLNGVIQDSDTPFVYEKVGSFYRNFLIDEFQDTSGLQWDNFLPLLLNGLDQGHTSLVVGDVKQAIYRWRGGDLSLLHQTVERHIGSERVAIKNLNRNFRSARTVVEFNNALFETASAMVSLETNHSLPSAAYADIKQEVFKDQEGYVHVAFLMSDEEKKWKDIALERIPLYLEELQGKGVPLKDIAILVRKNEEGQDVVNYLLQYKAGENAKAGMRYDVVSGESLRIDTAATVSLLEGAMKYLHNPDDALARAQLAFEFARIFEPARSVTEVFAVSNQAVFESFLPAEFAQQKLRLRKLPLFELTETLIGIFKLGRHKGELPYLQAFQNLVLDFFTRERNDLGAFLEWWENNKHKKSIPISGQVDAAQIITIHKSKGLQFKYVLMPFCSWATDHDTSMAPQLWVKSDAPAFADAGYIPVKYSSTLDRTHFKRYYQEERIRTALDNLNVLYVALTRAEMGLTVFAPHPDNKRSQKSVAVLLYESILRSQELLKYYNTALSELRMGSFEIAGGAPSAVPTHTVALEEYQVDSWRDKLVIRHRGKDFFEDPSDSRREKINYGLQLHHVLSQIRMESDIKSVLEKTTSEGIISRDEIGDLEKRLNALMQQPKVREWFTGDWEIKTEIPILLPEGSESRIDRLLIRGRRAVVIDFKTGDPVKADQNQVLHYLDVLRQMNYTETEGYLLYLRTGEIISVSPARTRLSRKKIDNQLDLGL